MAVSTGTVGGGASLTKSGVGTLILTKASVYVSGTYVNQGALQLQNNTASGTIAGGIVVANNAALELHNGITAGLIVGAEALSITGSGVSSGGALRNITGTNSYAGAVTIGNGGARINSDAGALTLTGGVVTSQFNNVTFGGAGNTTVSTVAISGAGGLIKDGAGTINLNFANTYTGGTTLNGGTTSFVNNALNSSGNVTFTGNSTLQWSGVNTQDLSSRLVMSNSVTSTLDTGANNVSFASGIGSSSSGALTKSGSGKLTLNGTNTYTGLTSISGTGTLALGATGSIDNSSGVALGTAGTFDVSAVVGGYEVASLTGSGTVVGALTVSTELAIGNSPGTVVYENGFTLGAASTSTFEVTGGGATADFADVNGTLTLTSGAILNLVQLGTYTVNDKFTLFAYNSLVGTFAGLIDGAQLLDNLGG